MRTFFQGEKMRAKGSSISVPLDYLLLEGKSKDIRIARAIVQGLQLGLAENKLNLKRPFTEVDSSQHPVLTERMPIEVRLSRYAEQEGTDDGSYKNTVIYGDEARLALDALDISIERGEGQGKVLDSKLQTDAVDTIAQFIAKIEQNS